MSRKKQKSATADATAELTVSSSAAASLFDVKPGTLRMWKTRGAAGSVGHNRWFLPDLMEWFQNNILESRLDTSDPELATSKRLYWHSKARRERLRADEEVGELLPKQEVIEQWCGRMGIFRNTLLEFSKRLPVRLANKPWHIIADTLKEEACWLLTALSKDECYCPLSAVPKAYIDAVKFSDDVDKAIKQKKESKK